MYTPIDIVVDLTPPNDNSHLKVVQVKSRYSTNKPISKKEKDSKGFLDRQERQLRISNNQS